MDNYIDNDWEGQCSCCVQRWPSPARGKQASGQAGLGGSGSLRHAATYTPLAIQFRVQVHSRSITKNILVVWRNCCVPLQRSARLSPAPLSRDLGRGAPARFRSSNPSARAGAGRGARLLQWLAAHVCARSRLVPRQRGNDLGDRSS